MSNEAMTRNQSEGSTTPPTGSSPSSALRDCDEERDDPGFGASGYGSGYASRDSSWSPSPSILRFRTPSPVRSYCMIGRSLPMLPPNRISLADALHDEFGKAPAARPQPRSCGGGEAAWMFPTGGYVVPPPPYQSPTLPSNNDAVFEHRREWKRAPKKKQQRGAAFMQAPFQWPTAGSVNHPHRCGPPCKFAAKTRGCKDGKACDHCHLCQWSRWNN